MIICCGGEVGEVCVSEVGVGEGEFILDMGVV